MIRESVGRSTLSSHLEWRPSQGDIDRVTALGISGAISPIGELFARAYIAQDRSSIGRLIKLVTQRIRPDKPMPTSWRQAIAKQAIHELMHWACQTCGGRGEVTSGSGVVYVCPEPPMGCAGVRIRRYDDLDRAQGIGVDLLVYHRAFARPLMASIDMVREEIRTVGSRLRDLLDEPIE